MSATLRARRNALAVLFLVPGIGMASWVTRTPDIRDLLGASTIQMGLVLFGLSLGSMAGILASGPLVVRIGAKPVIIAGTTLLVLSMPTIGAGAAAGLPLLTAAGLFLFGAGMGGGEVAMNVEGAEVERELARSFLAQLHGYFSLGTVIGAVLGILATAQAFPVLVHLALVGVAALAALVYAAPRIPAGTGRAQVDAAADALPARAPWKDPILLLIGAVILAMALAEGTANDWLPLVMVDGHGFDAALGSTIFAVFAAAMTIGRFAGGRFIDRFGRAAVLCASGVFAAVGLAVVVFVDNQVIVALAVLLWGLGASLGFPVAISAAGDTGPNAAARVSLVATLGYIAFLVGPPSLGIVGESFGLRAALLIPLGFVLLATAAAAALGARMRRAEGVSVPSPEPAPRS